MQFGPRLQRGRPAVNWEWELGHWSLVALSHRGAGRQERGRRAEGWDEGDAFHHQGPNGAGKLNRLVLALRAFWRILTDRDFAARVEPLFSRAPTGPDLRVLAVLQRDGRLVDFL